MDENSQNFNKEVYAALFSGGIPPLTHPKKSDKDSPWLPITREETLFLRKYWKSSTKTFVIHYGGDIPAKKIIFGDNQKEETKNSQT